MKSCAAALAILLAALSFHVAAAAPADQLPELTAPVNDFAHVIDPSSAQAIDKMIRQLKAATGDVVVVATVDTVEPYADIKEYANKLFENHGKGVGSKGNDNGLLIVLALKQRQVWIEVGYGLEQWITDGFSGETSRNYMVPEFRAGRYGAGLRAGTARIIGRIAEGRGVSIDGVQPVRDRQPQPEAIPFWVFLVIFIIILIVSRIGGGPGSGFRRRGYWGGSPWSGWSSGVGPFGGGFGGGGGGFGGGFGGFGGGRSGGGGGGASW